LIHLGFQGGESKSTWFWCEHVPHLVGIDELKANKAIVVNMQLAANFLAALLQKQ
jgi:hypothetical protein